MNRRPRHLSLRRWALVALIAASSVAPSLFAAQDEINKSSCLSALSLDNEVSKVVKLASQVEDEFKVNSLRVAAPGQPWFQFLPGQTKILILAPHATSQLREGHVKRADSGTGSLAIMMNRLAGTPVLYTFFQSPIDPNFYDSSPFKKKISELIAELKPNLVLDLHASAASRPYDIDFGTRSGKSLVKHPEYLVSLKKAMINAGLTEISDNFFAADKNETDTKWVSNLGVPCIQIEVNSRWLLPTSKPFQEQKFMHLVRGLVQFSKDFR